MGGWISIKQASHQVERLAFFTLIEIIFPSHFRLFPFYGVIYIKTVCKNMKRNIAHDIIIRAKDGDADAFGQLMRQHQNMVFSLALKMLADEQEAEDMVQDVFVHIWKHIRQYDPRKGDFAAWVYAVAAHACLDKIKRQKPLVALTDDKHIFCKFASGITPELQLCNKDWVSIIRVLASRLSPKQRIVFTLRMLENLSIEEITAITGTDPNKIKSNLYVARQKIMEQLKRLGYGK